MWQICVGKKTSPSPSPFDQEKGTSTGSLPGWHADGPMERKGARGECQSERSKLLSMKSGHWLLHGGSGKETKHATGMECSVRVMSLRANIWEACHQCHTTTADMQWPCFWARGRTKRAHVWSAPDRNIDEATINH